MKDLTQEQFLSVEVKAIESIELLYEVQLGITLNDKLLDRILDILDEVPEKQYAEWRHHN